MVSHDSKSSRIEPSFAADDRKNDADLSADERHYATASASRQGSFVKMTRRQRGKRRRFFSFMRRSIYWLFVLCLWSGLLLTGIIIYYVAQMPQTTSWTIPDRPPNVRIVDVNGHLLANRGTTGGEAIELHKMSPYIPQAVIAIEDRRFYSHFGIDPIGLARAISINIISGHTVQGGSTLTQQLAKNLFLTLERTLGRKIQEVLLALWLEHKYTKDQILEMYLNRVYLGSGSYGVVAASRRYFNKSAHDLNLMEAATLAGLLKAPSRLSPAHDPEAAAERAKLVLNMMRAQNMITDTELTLGTSEPITHAAAYWSGSENYVADQVIDELPSLIDSSGKDVIVHTTIDLNLQKIGEKSIHDLISANGKKMNVSQGALVSIDGTGAVRALVGGYDYASSQFNRATEARRQPGSTFKTFVYLASLEQGRTPDSIRNDAPVKIGKWTPRNYSGKYLGPVTLATALSHSLNSVAAQLLMEVGAKTVIDTAHRLGIQSNLVANASLALGTSEVTLLELTDAFVPFANGGYRAPVHIIKRITDSSGKVLYENTQGQEPRIIDLRNVGMMNAMLRRTIEDGTAQKAKFGWPAAGKTGTSQNFRDAWFIGYTANLTTGIWFGNDDGKPTKKVSGSSLPPLAWKQFMIAAHQGVPIADLPGNYQIKNVLPGGSDELPDMEITETKGAPQHKTRTLLDIIMGNE